MALFPDPYYAGSSRNLERQPRSGGLFWWTILITFLMGLVLFCWFFPIYIFARPEQPLNYKILSKLDKLESPIKFAPLKAPGGPFLEAKEVYDRYFPHSDASLAVENSLFKRRSRRNYADHGEDAVYLKGPFRIYHVRELTADDVLSSGVVLRARSVDYPTVILEMLVPAQEIPEEHFQIGDPLTLDRASTFASVLNIERLPGELLCVTAISLLYNEITIDEGRSITQAIPEYLNLNASWPVTSDSVGDPSSPIPVDMAAQ